MLRYDIDPTNMSDEEAAVLGQYIANHPEKEHFNTKKEYKFPDGVFKLKCNLSLLQTQSTAEQKIYVIYPIKAGIIGQGGYSKVKKSSGFIKVKPKSDSPVAIFKPPSEKQKYKSRVVKVSSSPYTSGDETINTHEQLSKSLELSRSPLIDEEIPVIRKKTKNIPKQSSQSETNSPSFFKIIRVENFISGQTLFEEVELCYKERYTLSLDEVLEKFILPLLKAYQEQVSNKHKDKVFIHRDIKPGNILVEVINKVGQWLPSQPKFNFIDTDRAMRENAQSADVFGTPGFVPPSILSALENKQSIVERQSRDLFALAIVIMFCLNPNIYVSDYINEKYNNEKYNPDYPGPLSSKNKWKYSLEMFKEMRGIFNPQPQFIINPEDLPPDLEPNKGIFSDDNVNFLFQCIDLPTDENNLPDDTVAMQLKDLIVDMMKNDSRKPRAQKNISYYITEVEKMLAQLKPPQPAFLGNK